MKINFDGHTMAISFDKVPRFLYFNEEGNGCGAVFLDGQRVKKLVSLRLESHTKYDKSSYYPLKYSITHGNEAGGHAPMEETIGNMRPDIQVGVKLLDLCKFKNAIEIMKAYANDERIPEDVRKEYAAKISEALESEEK